MKFLNFSIIFCLVLIGCDGKQGSTGPQGPQGNPGPTSFEITYQDGVFPTSTYGGTTNTWVDASNPTTSHSGAASLRVAMGPNPANSGSSTYSRALIKFDISSMPQNATVLKAALFLTTQTTTSISSGVTYLIGVNDMNVPLMISGGCTWNLGANWNFYNGSGSWSTCNFGGVGFVRGYHFVSTPMDSVTFTSSANAASKTYAWNLTPSVVQAWITGVNDGVVITSNSDAGEPTGNIDFYPNTDATASYHPTLVISYY